MRIIFGILATLVFAVVNRAHADAPPHAALHDVTSWHWDASIQLGGGYGARVRARGGVLQLVRDRAVFATWSAGATVAADSKQGFGGGVQLAAAIGAHAMSTLGLEHWTDGTTGLTLSAGILFLGLEWQHCVSGDAPRNAFYAMLNIPIGLLAGMSSAESDQPLAPVPLAR
ncbi:MAG: hypothetical protein IPK60_04280 [Sandaracinaceae bacterium]|nr:hypothetical protein [Sandaracinaceae bacterium]